MQNKAHGAVMEFQIKKVLKKEDIITWYKYISNIILKGIKYWKKKKSNNSKEEEEENIFSIHYSATKMSHLSSLVNSIYFHLSRTIKVANLFDSNFDKTFSSSSSLIYPCEQIGSGFLFDLFHFIFTGTWNRYYFLFKSTGMEDLFHKFNTIIFPKDFFYIPNQFTMKFSLFFFKGKNWIKFLNSNKREYALSSSQIEKHSISLHVHFSLLSQKKKYSNTFLTIGREYEKFLKRNKYINFKEYQDPLMNENHKKKLIIFIKSITSDEEEYEEEEEEEIPLVNNRKRSSNNNSSSSSSISSFSSKKFILVRNKQHPYLPIEIPLVNNEEYCQEEYQEEEEQQQQQQQQQQEYDTTSSSSTHYFPSQDLFFDVLDKVASAMYRNSIGLINEFKSHGERIFLQSKNRLTLPSRHYSNISKLELIESLLFQYVGHDMGCFKLSPSSSRKNSSELEISIQGFNFHLNQFRSFGSIHFFNNYITKNLRRKKLLLNNFKGNPYLVHLLVDYQNVKECSKCGWNSLKTKENLELFQNISIEELERKRKRSNRRINSNFVEEEEEEDVVVVSSNSNSNNDNIQKTTTTTKTTTRKSSIILEKRRSKKSKSNKRRKNLEIIDESDDDINNLDQSNIILPTSSSSTRISRNKKINFKEINSSGSSSNNDDSSNNSSDDDSSNWSNNNSDDTDSTNDEHFAKMNQKSNKKRSNPKRKKNFKICY
jgi:hypothetical protein